MIKRILAAVLLLCLFVSVVYAQSAATVFGWPPADGSISTAKLDDLGYIPFDATAEPPAYAEGRLFWDKDNGCPAFYPDMPGPVMQVGQEFWVRVKNAGVATMTNGSVICLNEPGAGIDPVAVLADASSIDTAKIIGVVTADISPDSSGYAAAFGLVRNLNTVGFTPGARIFLAAGSPGTFTETAPAAPNYSVVVGYVMKAHATAGSIYVRPWISGALDRAQFASVIHTATGTAAAPTYSFGSDPDTGIYSVGANSLGFSTGGVDRLKIFGDVGEAELWPNSTGYATLFAVASGSTAAGVAATTNGKGNIWFFGARKDSYGGASGTDRFNLLYGVTPLLTATIGGNILIGTSTDDGANKLQVNGFSKFGEAATGVKMKVLTGVTSGTAGSNTIAHGIASASYILSVTGVVEYTTGGYITTNTGLGDGYDSSVSLFGNVIDLYIPETAGNNLLGKPYKLLIWYTE